MLLFVNACVSVCAWETERDSSLLWNYLALQAWNVFNFGHFQFSVSHFFIFVLFVLIFCCLFVYTRSFCLFVCFASTSHKRVCHVHSGPHSDVHTHVCTACMCVTVCVSSISVSVFCALCLAFVQFRSPALNSTLLYSTLSFAWAASAAVAAAVAVAVTAAAAALRRCPLPPSSVTFSFSSHRQLQKATTKSCRCNLALHCCCPSAQLWRWLWLCFCLCLSRCCCLCRSLSLSDSLAEPAYQKRTLFSYAEELWRSKHEKNQRQTIKFLFVAFCIVVFVA